MYYDNGPLTEEEIIWYQAQPIGSVRDGERYRRLCLPLNYNQHINLVIKLDPTFAFLGLYPEIMNYRSLSNE